jgi:hypothetical protein
MIDNNPSDRYIIKQAMGILGRIKTAKKAEASKRNGKLGGRPRGKKVVKAGRSKKRQGDA